MLVDEDALRPLEHPPSDAHCVGVVSRDVAHVPLAVLQAAEHDVAVADSRVVDLQVGVLARVAADDQAVAEDVQHASRLGVQHVQRGTMKLSTNTLKHKKKN